MDHRTPHTYSRPVNWNLSDNEDRIVLDEDDPDEASESHRCDSPPIPSTNRDITPKTRNLTITRKEKENVRTNLTLYTIIFGVVSLLAGVGQSLVVKYETNIVYEGCPDCKPHKFNNAFLLTMFMFVGESFALLWPLFKRHVLNIGVSRNRFEILEASSPSPVIQSASGRMRTSRGTVVRTNSNVNNDELEMINAGSVLSPNTRRPPSRTQRAHSVLRTPFHLSHSHNFIDDPSPSIDSCFDDELSHSQPLEDLERGANFNTDFGDPFNLPDEADTRPEPINMGYTKAIMWWVTAAPLDLMECAFGNMALALIFASTVNMLHNFTVIISAVLTITMLRQRLTGAQWIGCVIVTISLILSSLPASGAVYHPEGNTTDGLIGVCLAILSTAIHSLQTVWEEKLFLKTKDMVSPSVAIGIEGVAGTVLCIIMLPLIRAMGGEDYQKGFYLIGHHHLNEGELGLTALQGIVLYTILSGIQNCSGLAVTNSTGGLLRTLFMALKPPVIWIFELFSGWISLDPYNISAMILLFVGLKIYVTKPRTPELDVNLSTSPPAPSRFAPYIYLISNLTQSTMSQIIKMSQKGTFWVKNMAKNGRFGTFWGLRGDTRGVIEWDVSSSEQHTPSISVPNVPNVSLPGNAPEGNSAPNSVPHDDLQTLPSCHLPDDLDDNVAIIEIDSD